MEKRISGLKTRSGIIASKWLQANKERKETKVWEENTPLKESPRPWSEIAAFNSIVRSRE